MNTIISNNIKYALASILTVAAIAYVSSCTKLENPEVNSEPEVENIVYPVYEIPVDVRVSSENQTKALYDENLAVAWEQTDKMLALKGKTVTPDSNTTVTDNASSLDFAGEISSEGMFKGKINSTCEPNVVAVFHFLYPNNGSSLSTSTQRTSSGILWGTTYKYTLTTSASVTIPSVQDSKWIPYLYGATSEVLSASDVALTPLTACLAFRVYESDGTTPKRVKSIVIEAENNIVGTISGSSSAQTEENSSASAAKTQALDLCAGPISNWTFNGTGKTITSTDLLGVEKMNGIYEYRFNIPAGVDFGALSVTMVDQDGTIIRRTVPAKAEGTAAGHKRNLKVKWDAASITLSANTWYEDYNTNQATALEGGKIYLSSTKFGMPDEVTPVYYVDGNQVSLTDGAVTATSGSHTVRVKATLNGEEIASDPTTVIVTKIPEVTSVDYWSSYTRNEVVTKRNDVDGNKVYAQVQLNDSYLQAIATSKITVNGNESGNSVTLDKNLVSDIVAFGNQDVGVSTIALPNGYTFSTTSTSREIVTGIPYFNALTSNITGWAGKNVSLDSGTGLQIGAKAGYAISPEFYVPTGSTINIKFTYDVYNNGALANTKKFCRGVVNNQSSSVNENDSSTPSAASWTNNQTSSSYSFNDNAHCIFFYAPNQTSYNVRVRNVKIEYR